MLQGARLVRENCSRRETSTAKRLEPLPLILYHSPFECLEELAETRGPEQASDETAGNLRKS